MSHLGRVVCVWPTTPEFLEDEIFTKIIRGCSSTRAYFINKGTLARGCVKFHVPSEEEASGIVGMLNNSKFKEQNWNMVIGTSPDDTRFPTTNILNETAQPILEFPEDPEPESCFAMVENLPKRVPEQLLKCLFPHAVWIDLPLNHDYTNRGYAVVHYHSKHLTRLCTERVDGAFLMQNRLASYRVADQTDVKRCISRFRSKNWRRYKGPLKVNKEQNRCCMYGNHIKVNLISSDGKSVQSTNSQTKQKNETIKKQPSQPKLNTDTVKKDMSETKANIENMKKQSSQTKQNSANAKKEMSQTKQNSENVKKTLSSQKQSVPVIFKKKLTTKKSQNKQIRVNEKRRVRKLRVTLFPIEQIMNNACSDSVSKPATELSTAVFKPQAYVDLYNCEYNLRKRLLKSKKMKPAKIRLSKKISTQLTLKKPATTSGNTLYLGKIPPHHKRDGMLCVRRISPADPQTEFKQPAQTSSTQVSIETDNKDLDKVSLETDSKHSDISMETNSKGLMEASMETDDQAENMMALPDEFITTDEVGSEDDEEITQ